MTVGIAALCENGSAVVCASDRMLTARNTQFQPEQQKILPLTSSISLIVAGRIDIQGALYARLQRAVRAHIDEKPDDWLFVETIANWYNQAYHEFRRAQINDALLVPLGLTLENFTGHAHNLSNALEADIYQRILRFDHLEVEAIVAGFDTEGAHIFYCGRGQTVRKDFEGFAAIGSGGPHAAAHFMSAGGHVASAGLAETLFGTYVAKKRSEAAPGVGSLTDMRLIGFGLGVAEWVGASEIREFDKIYRSMVRAENSARGRAASQFQTKLSEIAEAARKRQELEQPESEAPDPEMPSTHDLV